MQHSKSPSLKVTVVGWILLVPIVSGGIVLLLQKYGVEVQDRFTVGTLLLIPSYVVNSYFLVLATVFAILTSMVFARDVQSENYRILRTTQLTPHKIVDAYVVSRFYLFRIPIAIAVAVVIVRFIVTLQILALSKDSLSSSISVSWYAVDGFLQISGLFGWLFLAASMALWLSLLQCHTGTVILLSEATIALFAILQNIVIPLLLGLSRQMGIIQSVALAERTLIAGIILLIVTMGFIFYQLAHRKI